MNTIGYLFVLAALLLVRQISKGRVMNLGEDLTDTFIAIVSGDNDKLGEVLTRTGESNQVTTVVADTVSGAVSAAEKIAAHSLMGATITLGEAAKGYRWAATGPDYYDCSGLMWRACQKLGYTGPRFVTATVSAMPGFARSSNPGVNDLVVWPAHHMGVVTGPNKFYSARNVNAGIGYASIDGFRKDAPIYLTYTPPGKGKG